MTTLLRSIRFYGLSIFMNCKWTHSHDIGDIGHSWDRFWRPHRHFLQAPWMHCGKPWKPLRCWFLGNAMVDIYGRYMVDLLQNMCKKNTWTFAPSLEADEEIDGLDRFVRVFLRGPGSHETEQSQWPKIFLRLLGWWPWCGAVVTQLDMFWRVFPCDWNSPPLLGICSTSTGSGLICHSGWSIEDGSWLQHMVLESS